MSFNKKHTQCVNRNYSLFTIHYSLITPEVLS